jgi:GNAT superfamily N-acetyltransferase
MSMADHTAQPVVAIVPFTWDEWSALWAVRRLQLVEEGVPGSAVIIPERPQPGEEGVYEWDFHNIDQVYLRGAGHFWIARYAERPVGYVGGQDLGGAVELRRMYVNASYRRRGIGTALVQALIERSRAHAIPAIELWTEPDGPGRQLYQTLGFRVTDGLGAEFADVIRLTRETPGDEAIRMRLDLYSVEQHD